MRTRVLFLSAAALVLSTAPAAAQSGCTAILMEDPRPQSPQRAADSDRGAALREVTGTLAAAVVDAARQAGVERPEGLVVLEVRGRRANRVVVHTHRANVQEDLVRGVAAAHAELLATLPQRSRILHFRLDSLNTAALLDAVANLPLECAPRLANPAQVSEVLGDVMGREPPLPAGSDPRVRVRVVMLVTREGEVAYAELERGSRVGTLDNALLRAVRPLRFIPPAVGGEAVDAWAELPIELHMPVAPNDSGRRP